MRRHLNKKNQNDCKTGKKNDDEDKIGDEELLNFDKLEKRVNTVEGGSTGTMRNLRIFEDTAKYLLNLDLDSAYYDPKSRSMREDPNPIKTSNNYYTGDNSLKTSGKEYKEFIELQLHQLNSREKDFNYMVNASPSQAEAFLIHNKNQIKSNDENKINEV